MIRRLLHVMIVVLTLIIGATAAAVIVTQTAWFKNWLRVYIEREANQYLNGQMSIGRLGGNLFYGIELENIGVSLDGTQVVAVKDLGLDYSVFELISKGLSVDNIRLNKPVIYLRRDGDTWSISRLIKRERQEANRQGPARPISIADIGISDGAIEIAGPVGTSGVEVPKRFEHLDAKFNFKYSPVRYSIEITHVSFRGSEPAIGLNALSGGVSVRNDTVFVDKLAVRTEETSLSIDGAVENYLTKPIFKVQISSDKTSLPEIARLVPALAGIRLQPAFELKLDGPADHLGIDVNVRSSAGQVISTVTADVLSPGQSVTGDVSVRHLDLAPILNKARDKSDITANGRVDLHTSDFTNLNALRGTVKLDAPRVAVAGYSAEHVKGNARFEGRRVTLDGRAAAYGASATAKGRVTLPEGGEAVAYDLQGRAQHVDLRRLPRNLDIPPAATDVNAEYHVVGSLTSDVGAGRRAGPGGHAGPPLQQVQGDLRFEPSTIAGTRIAAGSTAAFSKSGGQMTYRADATVADLDLQRVSKEFNVPAIATDRFKSAIRGHVVANGSGTTPKETNLTASGTLTDTTILGGTIPQMTFDAALAHDTVHVKAIGGFAGFDPAVATGRPATKGTVAGTLDVDATVTGVSSGVTADSVEGTAKVDLQPSTIGGLAIDRATIDADYHNSTGEIRTLEIAGHDVNVTAAGTLALNETGHSNLKFHADTPNLTEIGKLVDLPLAGIAKVDGTLTGNKTELQASGNLLGDSVRYGENGALTLSSDYTVKIPELRVADAQVSAASHATFATLAGQNINDLTAKTDYANKQLVFDATANQPQRSLNAAGSLLIQSEHQEVHLQKLSLQTQGVTWQLAPGAQPAIQYASDAIAVKDLKLVSGNQQIAADGTFGRPDDAMKVTLDNVDLASVDTLLLRQPQFTGRAAADATITGTKDAPQVKAAFQINQGGFQQFHYDALTGTIDYAGKGVTLDMKLQQNPSAWMTAKGYVPTAALKAWSGGAEHGHAEPRSAEDRIDLHIDSNPIDLGVVQGFTTELTKVTGTIQAKIDVTGTAEDPHPTGAITLQNGAFTVEQTGVAYANFDGRIDLGPDRVHIDHIRLVDNHQQPMSISGDLAVHELEVGGVNLALKAHDFKVLDNNMGNVRIDSDLRLAGELRQPRLEGDLGMTTGVINLDPILAQMGESAYATTPIEYLTEPAAATKGQVAPPSVFEALQMDVHITVPDDLVVKGSELGATDTPVGFGALSVTLGGDVRAQKNPGGWIRLVGIVNTVRGTYDFQGRRFDIRRDGTVRFVGLEEINPILDIRAQRVIRGVEARVNIRGSLQQPEIELTSTPSLEQAEILSLIVFNESINQIGEGQQISLAQRAAGIAAGALAGQIAQSIGEALNLNIFEIQVAPESGATAQLTVGQQVGQNLFVKVQQDLGDQSSTNFIFEYQLKNWLRLQSNFLQGTSTQQSLFRRAQGSGADLIFFFSY